MDFLQFWVSTYSVNNFCNFLKCILKVWEYSSFVGMQFIFSLDLGKQSYGAVRVYFYLQAIWAAPKTCQK
jgi:hypothetical protein